MKKLYFLLLSIVLSQAVYCQDQKDIFEIARNGSVAEAQVAIKINPKSVNAVNSEGYSPLILACYRGNKDVAKFIMENGGDINAKSGMGTPLMAAVVKNNTQIVDLLLQKHADTNITDGNGTTALIYASMFKNHDIAKLLVKSGASADAKDNRGNSAIDYAILANDDELIQILKTKL